MSYVEETLMEFESFVRKRQVELPAPVSFANLMLGWCNRHDATYIREILSDFRTD